MSIDWMTVAAQIANFLVLVWLLKKFLYRPILDGIDAREAEIADRMQEAVLAKQGAEAAAQDYHDKTHALNLAQADLAETVRKTAEAQRDVLLADARTRLTQEQAAWQDHRQTEARAYTAELHRTGAQALLALTRKAVLDLADQGFEARVAQHLIGQLDQMAPELRRAAGSATEAVVTSQAALSGAVQAEITDALREQFPKIALRFDVAPDQTPGLGIQLGGAQLVWTVASYIEGLEALVSGALTTKGQADA